MLGKTSLLSTWYSVISTLYLQEGQWDVISQDSCLNDRGSLKPSTTHSQEIQNNCCWTIGRNLARILLDWGEQTLTHNCSISRTENLVGAKFWKRSFPWALSTILDSKKVHTATAQAFATNLPKDYPEVWPVPKTLPVQYHPRVIYL